MRTHRLVTLAAVALVLSAPGLVSATSLWHTASGEASDSFHPDHIKSTKTRAQVMAEVEAARKDGTLAILQRGAPLPIKSSEAPKTRQDNDAPAEEDPGSHLLPDAGEGDDERKISRECEGKRNPQDDSIEERTQERRKEAR